LQLDLFPSGGITQWLPDETLFSLASRHHVKFGHLRASQTCLQLFGHSQRGSAHDLPSRIDDFVRRTNSEFGSAVSIIRERTILPFYLPFRSQTTADGAIAAMRGDGIGTLKYRLGILTSRFRAHHPLKACLQCMTEDRALYGSTYWHLAHQFPGVWFCPVHDSPLLESVAKSNGIGRFLWHLPNESTLRTAVEVPGVLSTETLQLRLASLVEGALELARLPSNFYFDPIQLRATHHETLRERGKCTGTGRLRLRMFTESYLAFVRPLRRIAEFAALPATPSQASSQLGRLLYASRTGTHPLRHVVFILWLYGSWENFWQVYWRRADEPCAKDIGTRPTPPNANALRGEVHEALLGLIRNGYSTTRAAHTVGIDTDTAIAWAAQAGIATPRRAKQLRPHVRRGVVNDLRRGLGKKTVASRNHVSLQCVTRTLRSEVGLRQIWREVHHQRLRTKARHEWREAVRKPGVRGPKATRLLAPAAYAWLYRNDRAWLRAQVQSQPGVPRSNHVAVNWEGRDNGLAQSVERACSALAQRMPMRAISVRDVHREVPQLRAKWNQLDRLPRTRQVLQRRFGRLSTRKMG